LAKTLKILEYDDRSGITNQGIRDLKKKVKVIKHVAKQEEVDHDEYD